jgi:hypothetical protein
MDTWRHPLAPLAQIFLPVKKSVLSIGLSLGCKFLPVALAASPQSATLCGCHHGGGACSAVGGQRMSLKM